MSSLDSPIDLKQEEGKQALPELTRRFFADFAGRAVPLSFLKGHNDAAGQDGQGGNQAPPAIADQGNPGADEGNPAGGRAGNAQSFELDTKGAVSVPPNGDGTLDNQSFMDPALRAFSARLGYFSITGTLTANNDSLRRTLAKAGPVGEKLVARLDDMQGRGWQFKSVGIGDRYLRMESPGMTGRLVKMGTLGGYHYDFFRGERLKTLAYNNWMGAIGGVTGSGYGTSNPLKHLATVVGHELSHEDGTKYDFHKNAKLTLAEQQTLAKRLLATETRAVLTQLHLADRLGDSHMTNDMLRSALRRRDLGGFIYDNWGKSSSTYSSFQSIDRTSAGSFVNDLIDEMDRGAAAKYKNPLVDYRTGRVGAFDIDAGLGNDFGKIAGDADLDARMRSNIKGNHSPEGKLGRFFSGTKSGRVLGRGMQTAGAVGAIVMLADVKSAFDESAAAGTARLSRVGLDWAAFEAGTALGARAGRGLSMISRVKVPLAALPLCAMAAGFGVSYLADSQLGDAFENKVKSLW